MNARYRAAGGGIWALLWRSFVFTPCMLAVFLLVGGVWLGRWLLPFFVVLFLIAGLWREAAEACGVWLLLAWSFRRFRMRRLFEEPPSLL